MYIVIRYNKCVSEKVSNAEYQSLAELRFRIRRFVQEGDAAARAAGLEPQQYLLLLASVACLTATKAVSGHLPTGFPCNITAPWNLSTAWNSMGT